MTGDCHLEPPDPTKSADPSQALVHDCGAPPPHVEPPQPDPRSNIERIFDKVTSWIPGLDSQQTAATDKMYTDAHLDLEQFAQTKAAVEHMSNEAFHAFSDRPDLFKTADDVRNAMHVLERGYTGFNPDKTVTTPLTTEQQAFVDDFGRKHSKDNPNQFLQINRDFPWVYVGPMHH